MLFVAQENELKYAHICSPKKSQHYVWGLVFIAIDEAQSHIMMSLKMSLPVKVGLFTGTQSIYTDHSFVSLSL